MTQIENGERKVGGKPSLEPSLDILAGLEDGRDGYNFSRLERYRLLYHLQFGHSAPGTASQTK